MSATRTSTRTGRGATAADTSAAAPDTPAHAASAAPTPDAATRTVPGYAAGCGLPRLVLDTAADLGFQCATDENQDAWAVSPDGLLRVDFGPESSRYAGNPMGGLWLITYTDPDQPRNGWRAQFGDNCPAEAIVAFIKALLIGGGLDPERADSDSGETQITVQITTGHAPAKAEEQAMPGTQPADAQATAPADQ
jgi:hypothetical protein